MFKSVSSLSQRWVSLRRGSEISLETQLKIIPYVNCTVQFLNNDKYIEYVPEAKYDTEHLKDTETIFDILPAVRNRERTKADVYCNPDR